MAVSCRLWLLLVCLIILLRFTKCFSTNVSLEFQQEPAVFGQNFTIQCTIENGNRPCDNVRQWYGGRHYSLLCVDGSCSNENKYIEKEIEACSYMLIISYLSENDLNYYYGCQYGFIHARKKLMMDEPKFRYIPTNDDINLELTTVDERSVNIVLNVKMVFPKPKCQIDLTETDKITFLREIKKSGSFYRMSLNATIPRKLLPGCNLRIVCNIGERTVTLVDKKMFECNSKDSTNEVKFSVVAVVVALFLVVLSCVILSYIFRNGCRKGRDMKMLQTNDRCINMENEEKFDFKKDNHVINSAAKELGQSTHISSNPYCIKSSLKTDVPLMTITTEVAVLNSVDTEKQFETSTVRPDQTTAIPDMDKSNTEREYDDDNSISFPITADDLKDKMEPLLVNVPTQCKMDTSQTVDEETLPLNGEFG